MIGTYCVYGIKKTMRPLRGKEGGGEIGAPAPTWIRYSLKHVKSE